MFDPCGLEAVACAVVRGEPFDGLNVLAIGRRNGGHAGANRVAVEADRACATLRDPASELRACQAKLFSNRPEQRRGGIDVDLPLHAVHRQYCHCVSTP